MKVFKILKLKNISQFFLMLIRDLTLTRRILFHFDLNYQINQILW